jgi:predicted Zn-dependent protease
VLAAGNVTFHRFAPALATERAGVEAAPFDDRARAQMASTLMEMGRYEEAARVLDHPVEQDPDPTWMSIRARYGELTGNPAGARIQMAQAMALVD